MRVVTAVLDLGYPTNIQLSYSWAYPLFYRIRSPDLGYGAEGRGLGAVWSTLTRFDEAKYGCCSCSQ